MTPSLECRRLQHGLISAVLAPTRKQQIDIERLWAENDTLICSSAALSPGRQNRTKNSSATKIPEIGIAARLYPPATAATVFVLRSECYLEPCRHVIGLVVRAAELAIVIDIG